MNFESVEQNELWERIASHSFEDKGGAMDICRRLASENSLSLDDARELIGEYRKFCFLAMVCNHKVTPSEEVDLVWHMHLIHTQDYWNAFCKDVLGRELHHGPTKGGVKEQTTFEELYAMTLVSYARFFGVPQLKWWPSVYERFKPYSRWRWLNLDRCWRIRIPSILRKYLSHKLKPIYWV